MRDAYYRYNEILTGTYALLRSVVSNDIKCDLE